MTVVVSFPQRSQCVTKSAKRCAVSKDFEIAVSAHNVIEAVNLQPTYICLQKLRLYCFNADQSLLHPNDLPGFFFSIAFMSEKPCIQAVKNRVLFRC